MTKYSYKIFLSTNQLPETWDVVSKNCKFLQTEYLKVLENASPTNIQCNFIGIFERNELIATSILQKVNLSSINPFKDNRDSIFNKIRNYIFKKYSSKVLIIGNNFHSGQNAFSLGPNAKEEDVLQVLFEILNKLKNEFNFSIIKDFNSNDLDYIPKNSLYKKAIFSTQPTMVFHIPSHWKSEDDYFNELQKKYRDNFKRCRKRMTGVTSKELSEEEIQENLPRINELYLEIANKASFNTFFLPENHFFEFKNKLKEDFIFRGYFKDTKLIGFNSIIRNGENIETYFLGYDLEFNTNNKLYANMLLDMVNSGIKFSSKSINFGRTALEIKSSIGAEPIELSGIVYHSNKLINLNLRWIYNIFEPKINWQLRTPFKVNKVKNLESKFVTETKGNKKLFIDLCK